MAQRRRRHLRRDVLVFLGSLVGHALFFYAALNQFHFYPQRQESPEAVQVEIVPQPETPIPPPVIIPHIKETIAPTQQPPAPQPTQQPQPQPKPQPQPTPPQTPQRPTPTPVQTPTAPATSTATPTPAPRPAPAPLPLAPAPQAPQPGPPKSVSRTLLTPSHAVTAATPTPSPRIVLHKDKDQTSTLAPAFSIPGATFAPPAPQASGPPAGGAPGGSNGLGGLPGGALPGFGKGLRGGVLGCANAEALHFTPAERAHCAEEFGAGAKESPQMDAIDASKRQLLDQQAAQASAAQKYRDSTPSGTESTPVQGQPRLGHPPGEQP